MSTVRDPTAVMGQRIGAVVIDGAVVFVPGLLAFYANLQTRDFSSSAEASAGCDSYDLDHPNSVCSTAGSTMYFTDGAGAAPYIIFGLSIFMFVILQGLTGWTLGKLMTGIRTVQEDGRVVGIPRALVRWLFWIIDSLPILWLVGLITSLTTTGHRRVGDMVAKSFVVDKGAVGQPVRVPGMAGSAPITTGTPSFPAPTAQHGPQWDEARGTYIQWDPELKAWMQWDESARAWNAIPGPSEDPPPPPPPPPPGS